MSEICESDIMNLRQNSLGFLNWRMSKARRFSLKGAGCRTICHWAGAYKKSLKPNKSLAFGSFGFKNLTLTPNRTPKL